MHHRGGVMHRITRPFGVANGIASAKHKASQMERGAMRMRSSVSQTGSRGRDDWKLSSEGVSPVLTGTLNGLLSKYWERTPTAASAMDFLRDSQVGPLYFDHFAFRSFGVNGCGIDALAKPLLAFGYTRRDPLTFKKKKLSAYWFSPPSPELPRIFISELQVEQFPEEVQAIIQKYTKQAQSGSDYLLLSGLLGTLPWDTPSSSDYETLAQVSEYAAWTLANGCALNHTTISVHNLASLNKIDTLVDALQSAHFRLNDSGGLIKISPDGRLQQTSTVADMVEYTFEEGTTQPVPGPYIEFAERLILPQYEHLPLSEIEEHHRRDGFEEGNADKIFESTTLAA